MSGINKYNYGQNPFGVSNWPTSGTRSEGAKSTEYTFPTAQQFGGDTFSFNNSFMPGFDAQPYNYMPDLSNWTRAAKPMDEKAQETESKQNTEDATKQPQMTQEEWSRQLDAQLYAMNPGNAQVLFGARNAINKGTGAESVEQMVQAAYIADHNWKIDQKRTAPAGQAEAKPEAADAEPAGETQQSSSASSGDELYERLKQGKVLIQPGDLEKIDDFNEMMTMDPNTAKTIIGNMLFRDPKTGETPLNTKQRDLLAVRLMKAMTNNFVDGIGLKDVREGGFDDTLDDDTVSTDDMELIQKALEETGNQELIRIAKVMNSAYGQLEKLEGGMSKSGLSEAERMLLQGKDLGGIIADLVKK